MSHCISGKASLMKITQLRNATIVISIGGRHILVDPMLAPRAMLPPLRIFDGQMQRNPIVELPGNAELILASVTHCLITHCQKGHFDHLDGLGKKWLREKQIPVICTPHDAQYLRKRGLNVQSLPDNHEQPGKFFEGTIKTIRCTHGEGLVGRFMEHGVGYLIEMPGEPSLYLAGDTILTAAIREFVVSHQPDVCVIPAGGARMDVGSEIIMGQHDVIAFAQLAKGVVVANHLEALSHCPVRRSALKAASVRAVGNAKLLVPVDGETLEF